DRCLVPHPRPGGAARGAAVPDRMPELRCDCRFSHVVLSVSGWALRAALDPPAGADLRGSGDTLHVLPELIAECVHPVTPVRHAGLGGLACDLRLRSGLPLPPRVESGAAPADQVGRIRHDGGDCGKPAPRRPATALPIAPTDGIALQPGRRYAGKPALVVRTNLIRRR